MTLKQLEAFYWAAISPSFAAAAGQVNLTVSSLSKRLAELEASLGQPLFDRSGHKASLTAAGERLLPQAIALLQQTEAVKKNVSLNTGLQGRCRIGSGELASITWLPRWIHQLRQTHHELEITVATDIGEGLAERLEKGDLDVAVIAGHARRLVLTSIPLAEAAFVWCARPDIAHGAGMVESLSFGKHALITLPRGSGMTHVLDDWLENANVKPGQKIVCNQWGVVAGLIVEGAGIGFLPVGLAKGLLLQQKIALLSSNYALKKLDYHLHFRHDDPRSLVTELTATCLEMVDFEASGVFF
ncbi:LysR family transcriptional regulator [Advenella sp. RU8]|uniref:LysR family transcriptional regulator n=1 Tax=Advenella sp. RU8 TaxID=3399575 RepID=UPI003AAFA86C